MSCPSTDWPRTMTPTKQTTRRRQLTCPVPVVCPAQHARLAPRLVTSCFCVLFILKPIVLFPFASLYCVLINLSLTHLGYASREYILLPGCLYAPDGTPMLLLPTMAALAIVGTVPTRRHGLAPPSKAATATTATARTGVAPMAVAAAAGRVVAAEDDDDQQEDEEEEDQGDEEEEDDEPEYLPPPMSRKRRADSDSGSAARHRKVLKAPAPAVAARAASKCRSTPGADFSTSRRRAPAVLTPLLPSTPTVAVPAAARVVATLGHPMLFRRGSSSHGSAHDDSDADDDDDVPDSVSELADLAGSLGGLRTDPATTVGTPTSPMGLLASGDEYGPTPGGPSDDEGVPGTWTYVLPTMDTPTPGAPLWSPPAATTTTNNNNTVWYTLPPTVTDVTTRSGGGWVPTPLTHLGPTPLPPPNQETAGQGGQTDIIPVGNMTPWGAWGHGGLGTFAVSPLASPTMALTGGGGEARFQTSWASAPSAFNWGPR